MQVFEKGTLIIREGNLFTPNKKGEEIQEELVVQTTEKGKRYVKFNISVSTGSTKQDDGSYKDNYEYYEYTVWDNGGASKEFIDFVDKPPSEKLQYKRLNRVKLIAYIKKSERTYEGKTYYGEEIVDFLHLYKILGNTPKKEDSNDTSVKPKSDVDDIAF